MSNAATKTTNTQLQKFGGDGSQALNPADYDRVLDTIEQGGPLAVATDPTTYPILTTPATTVLTSFAAVPLRRIRLTLTAFSVAVAAGGFGGSKLMTLPTNAGLILGAEFNLTATKDGVGVVAANTPTVALGQAVGTTNPLVTTQQNVDTGVALAATLVSAAKFHSNQGTFAPIPVSTATSLYLNVGGAVTGAGTVLFTGTVDLFVADTGPL